MKEFKTLITFVLDYSEFDDLTKEVYGRQYDFVPSEEARNDSEYLFSGITAEPLDETDAAYVAKFMNGGQANWIAHYLLQDMCRREVIPPGNYLIRVCW